MVPGTATLVNENIRRNTCTVNEVKYTHTGERKKVILTLKGSPAHVARITPLRVILALVFKGDKMTLFQKESKSFDLEILDQMVS